MYSVIMWQPRSARSLTTGRLVANSTIFLYSLNIDHMCEGSWSQSWGPDKSRMSKISQETGVIRELSRGLLKVSFLQSRTGNSGLPGCMGTRGML